MNVVELNNFFENYNHELTTAQQKNMLKNMDGDGNGRADFQEFITCLIFVKFDLDKNGGLSVDEVLMVIRHARKILNVLRFYSMP